MNPKVDVFLEKSNKWQKEMARLRSLILECGLEEDLKWGKPCYAYQNHNVVLIQPFKDYLAVLFFKGALLTDTEELLIKFGENTQAGRQLRYTDIKGVENQGMILKAYIYEAIDLEKSGRKVELKRTSDYPVVEELQQKLDAVPALKSAFDALTPGRKRAYLIYFAQAKQSKTRETRIEKCIPAILAGKGLNE